MIKHIELINGKLNSLDQKYVDGTLKINGISYNFPFTNATCVARVRLSTFVTFDISLECNPIEKFNSATYLHENMFDSPTIGESEGLSKLVNDSLKLGVDVLYMPPEQNRRVAKLNIRLNDSNACTYDALDIKIRTLENKD